MWWPCELSASVVAADVSVDAIRKLEQGRRHTASIATLARLARVLGVDAADLLSPSQPTSTAHGQQNQVIARSC
jgi:transcriptional regulator with XRE-family HTH domain